MLSRERHFMLFGLPASESSWRGFALLMLIYLGAMLFSAIASPLIYWSIQWLYGVFPDTFEYLAHKGFEDYFDRLRWLPLLFLLPWLMMVCRLDSLRTLGLSLQGRQLDRLIGWFIFGIFLCALAAGIQFFNTGSEVKAGLEFSAILGILLKAFGGGIILGIIEETLFRGIVLRIFYTAFAPMLAVIFSALFFASVHFKMPDHVWQEAFPVEQVETAEGEQPPPVDAERVKIWSGFFVALWTFLGVFADWQPIWFLNLFLLGIILNLLTLRTHSLMPSIGMHAGLVGVMLSYQKITEVAPGGLWLGAHKIVDGLIPTVIFIIMIIVLLLKPKDPTAHLE